MAVNRYYSSNAVDTTLVTGVDASATEIVLASTAGMPQSYPFTLALDYDTSSEELVNVVGIGSTTGAYKIGVVVGTASVAGRGIDGNAATAHAAGAAVKHVISARDIREAQEHINATTKYTVTNGATTYDVNLHGIAAGEGAVVGTAKAQTLTNKSISSTGNTLSVAQADVVNLTSDLALKAPLASPTFTGTVTLPTGTVTSGMIADGAIVNADINASAAIDWTKLAVSSTVSATEVGYLDGVTSAIQTQINAALEAIVPKATVTPFAGTTAPTGWLLCDGSAKSTVTNPELAALFSVIGNTYGGTNNTDFKLPDLRGRAPIGAGTGTGLSARALAATVGVESVTLTAAQSGVAAHSHTASASTSVSGGNHTHTIAVGTPEETAALSGTTMTLWRRGATTTEATNGEGGHTHTSSTSVTVDNASAANAAEAHTNMQPSLALNYIIKY